MTPLQMATVAATVANGGVRMEPHLDQPDRRRGWAHRGADRARRRPSASSTPTSARELTAMMSNVVREGTGVGAALEGIEVAGKTGTAELQHRAAHQPAVVHRLRAARQPEGRASR